MTIILSSLLLLLAAFLVFTLWPGKKPAESVTLYYAVDADGTACLYTGRPTRDTSMLIWLPDDGFFGEVGDLKVILPPLTWADEPFMVSLSLTDRSDLNTTES